MAGDESECSSVDSDVDSDCSTDEEALGSSKRRHVTFARNVRFHSTKPRRSYKDREHEVIKVDVEAMAKDENRAVELEAQSKTQSTNHEGHDQGRRRR